MPRQMLLPVSVAGHTSYARLARRPSLFLRRSPILLRMKTILNCGFSGPEASDLLIAHGPTIFVNIGFDPGWRLGLTPAANKQNVPALVDTGALESFIDCDL